MYVTGEMQLIENGVVHDEALALLAQRAMIINPTVEVYLLDTEGRILAHALPPDSIQTDRVALQPVRKLIAADTEMPLRGTDPRNLDRQKIFSAHPVMHNDVLQGYLYAILGGQKYDELADSLRGSYVQRLSFGALGGDRAGRVRGRPAGLRPADPAPDPADARCLGGSPTPVSTRRRSRSLAREAARLPRQRRNRTNCASLQPHGEQDPRAVRGPAGDRPPAP